MLINVIALFLCLLPVKGFKVPNQISVLQRNTLINMATKDSTKSPKQSWELGRFIRTANFYGAFVPKLPFLSKKPTVKSLKPGSILWSTSENPYELRWGPLDDVVMGGVSKSSIEPGETFDGTWKGIVSTANNGGFAGIRTKLFKLDASACSGILLKVRGDGQRYKVIVRDDEDWNGTAWSESFDTVKGRTTEIKLPFNKFKPTRFARVLPSFRPFDKKNFSGIQISLSKFEYDGDLNPRFKDGPFELQVLSFTSY
jgi:hypothetical protein